MSNPSDLERRLRASLAEQADRAPSGRNLDERILAAVRTVPGPAGRQRGWATWTMPLLAAAAVAAIVGGVFLVVAQVRPSASPGPVALNSGTGSVVNSTLPSSTPTPSPTTAEASSTEASSTPGATRSGAIVANPVGVRSFTASDLTFYGSDDAWAIGTAICLDGSGARCPAMVHSADGGRSWHSMPQPPGDVTGIRFANAQLGYAFSATTLEMTTDGGKTWTPQSGGAVALETFDNNVIRVVPTDPGGCPPGCTWQVSTAPLGSSSWTPATLPGPRYAGDGVSLVRTGHLAFLISYGHVSGGAGKAPSVLFRSKDDGATWTRLGEPCPQRGATEVDSVAIAAAPGGTTVLCQVRQAGAGADFLASSSNGGLSFTATGGSVPQFAADVLAGDPTTVLVAAGQHAYRSVSGGKAWVRIDQISGTVSFAGFESPKLGRIVTDGGATIWTTRDGGASWGAYRFP